MASAAPPRPFTSRAGIVVATAAVCLLGCNDPAPSKPHPADPTPAATTKRAAPEPVLLLSNESSAYHARLFGTATGFYLLTDTTAFRLVPGASPQSFPLPRGADATWSEPGPTLWIDGNVVRLELSAGRRTVVTPLPDQPRLLTTSGDSVGWLSKAPDGTSLLGSTALSRPAYRSQGYIETVTMLSDWLFFVERMKDSSWRLGAVPTSGGSARFTPARQGRAPAMLVASDEALYYYDGNAFEVRRASPDLESESVVGHGVCSPLAVSGSVFCARVEGVFELAPDEPPRQLAAGGPRSLITDIAATPRHVAWVSEAGTDRLEVHVIERSRSNP